MTSFSEYARLQQEKAGNKVVIPLVKEYLQEQWYKESDRIPNRVHASEMAKKDWCERSSYWRIIGRRIPNEPFNFTLQTIFDEGHQIHDKWQGWLKETGKLWGLWECRMCHETKLGKSEDLDMTFDPEWGGLGEFNREDYCELGHGEPLTHMWKYQEVPLNYWLITGHEDGAVGNTLVEFKSVGLGTLRHESPELLSKFYNKTLKMYDLDGLWNALRQPLKSHVRQANVYGWLAQQMGYSFTQASIVYEFKPNQQSREFIIPFSPEIISPLLERVARIETGIASHTPPPCPYGGCKYCKAYEAGTTPDASIPSRTVLVRRPPEGNAAGNASASQAPRRYAVRPRGRDGAERQLADEAVPPADGLAEVPGHPARPGGGGRKVLVKKASSAGEGLRLSPHRGQGAGSEGP